LPRPPRNSKARFAELLIGRFLALQKRLHKYKFINLGKNAK